MSRKYNFALIGLGRAGTIHFGNIYSSLRCHLKYIIDQDVEKLRQIKDECKDDRINYVTDDNYETVMDDQDLDAVVICTPTYCHESNILSALRKGKSVFCEKPISSSCDGIKACYKFAEEKGLILHCSLNRRFDPSLQKMYQSMRSHALGRVHVIKTCSRDNPKPSFDYIKISNGIFHDCAVHDLDMVIWLLDKRPISLYVTAFNEDEEFTKHNDYETVIISLTFEDGTLGVIELSRQSTYGYDQRVEIHGNKGMIQSLGQTPDNVVNWSCTGAIGSNLKYSFKERYRESYVNSLNEFIDCLSEGKQSSVKGEEVLFLAKLADLCEESCKSRQAVNIPLN